MSPAVWLVRAAQRWPTAPALLTELLPVKVQSMTVLSDPRTIMAPPPELVPVVVFVLPMNVHFLMVLRLLILGINSFKILIL